MRRRLATIFCVLAALGLRSLPCQAAPHYDYTMLYQRGRKATLEGYPHKAVLYLSLALEQDSMEGEPWVIVYGHNREPYLPHFYLGLALYNLGAYTQALEEWRESERQGAIRDSPEKQKILEEKRGVFWREVVPQMVRAGHIDREDTTVTLKNTGELLRILQAVGGQKLDSGQQSIRIAETLSVADKALDTGERDKDFRKLDEARRAVAAVQIEAVRLLSEVRARLMALDSSRLDSILGETLVSLDAGRCRREALTKMAALRMLLVFRPDLRSEAREIRLGLGLARASLQCDDLEPAAQNLMEVSQAQGAPAEEVASLERELSEARTKQIRSELADFETRDTVLAGFAESAVAIDAGICSQTVIERLRHTAEVVRQRSDRRQLGSWITDRAGLPYLPQFYLAKAYTSCDDVENAEKSLERSRERQELWAFGYRREAEAIGSWIRRERVKGLYSGSHALVILASHYRHWPELRGVEEEEKEIKEKLEEIGFPNPKIVHDPSKKLLELEIRRFISDFGQGEGNRNRLLIYFAGHGVTLKVHDAQVGYLVPVDAAKEPAQGNVVEFIESAIGMDEIDGWVRQINAIHTIVILNSCYSGMIFHEMYRTRGSTTPLPDTDEAITQVVQEAVRERVHYFITAGNAEHTVPDSGVFLRTLLKALTWKAEWNYLKGGFLLGSQLCLFLKTRQELASAGLTPQCGIMPQPTPERGDIIFTKPPEGELKAFNEKAQAPADLLSDLAFWKDAEEARAGEGYHRYLERYPKGRFAGLARYRLLRIESPSP